VSAGVELLAERLLREGAGQHDEVGGPVQARGAGVQRVRVHRRLLLAAEPGVAGGAAEPVGPADGDHGLPAADAEGGVTAVALIFGANQPLIRLCGAGPFVPASASRGVPRWRG